MKTGRSCAGFWRLLARRRRVLLVAVARLLCSGRLSARIEVPAQDVYRCNERACSISLFRETAIRSPVVLGGCVAHLAVALAPTVRDFKLCFHDVTWGRLVVGSRSLALQRRTRSRFEEQPNGLRTGPRRKETAADRPPEAPDHTMWRLATLVRGARRATRCILLDSK